MIVVGVLAEAVTTMEILGGLAAFGKPAIFA
jgi:hypothetical protein